MKLLDNINYYKYCGIAPVTFSKKARQYISCTSFPVQLYRTGPPQRDYTEMPAAG